MSENLARAAEVLGAPEILVQRSAEARAAADGVPVEEVLAAWAGGGGSPSSSASAPAAAPEPSPAPASAPEPSPVPAAAPEPSPAPTAPSAPSPAPVAASAPDPLPPPSEVTAKEAVSFPVVVSVPTARLTERTSSTLPRWLAALFLVIPVIGLLYLAGNSARAGCVEGGVQLAVNRLDSTVVNCDGSEFTGRAVDTTGNILAVGEAVFETCAGCHGANGEGGVGPALATVLTTFSSCPDHIEWVALATGGFQEAGIDTYGDLAATVGGGGFMPGFATSNTADEIAAVVAFERIRFGGADPDQTLVECGLVQGDEEPAPEEAGTEEEALPGAP
ncbi:MAG: cytochrome c [Acidimicrobiia bacterium]|nr:cytochrome c [Acidimicrobiia bacterium]MYD40636.1 cytochrome c [Acidimicrobiia bacterium]